MQEMSTAEARKNLAELVNRAAYTGERTVVTRHGKPVAALVPVADLELLSALEDRLDREAALAALAEPGGIEWDELKEALRL